jgi:hypothetical protein
MYYTLLLRGIIISVINILLMLLLLLFLSKDSITIISLNNLDITSEFQTVSIYAIIYLLLILKKCRYVYDLSNANFHAARAVLFHIQQNNLIVKLECF